MDNMTSTPNKTQANTQPPKIRNGGPRALLFGGLFLGAVGLSACSGAEIDFSFNTDSEEGSGDLTTQAYDVSEFEGISVCCGLDVEIEFEEASTQSVEITIDDNLHEFLDIEVRDSTLRIEPENDVNLDSKDPVLVTITGPDLEALEVSAGSNVTAVWPTVASLDLDVDAGADVTLTVDTDMLTVDADAGTDVTLDGRADIVVVTADAAADVRLTAVKVKDATLEASAGSDIEIEASGTITGSADAGSDIDIWGDPDRVDIDVDVSSDLNYKN